MSFAQLRLPALFLTAFAFAAAARADVIETVKKSFPLSPDGSIRLENVNGTIEITAWDQPEVEVVAEKYGKTDEDLRRIAVSFDAAPAALTIKTRHEKKLGFFGNEPRGGVRYQVRVPAAATLAKVDSVNSRIIVRGVRGHADIDTVNGDIEASGVAAGGRFDTVNGSITVDAAALPADAKLDLDSVNGACRLTLPKDAAFSLHADTVNGRVSCDFPITLEKSTRHTLRGKVGDARAHVKLDSVNGSLSIRAR